MSTLVANPRKRNWKKATGLRIGLLKEIYQKSSSAKGESGSSSFSSFKYSAFLTREEVTLRSIASLAGYFVTDAGRRVATERGFSLEDARAHPPPSQLLANDEVIKSAMAAARHCRRCEAEKFVEREFRRLALAVDGFEGGEGWSDEASEEEAMSATIDRIWWPQAEGAYWALRELHKGRGNIFEREQRALEAAKERYLAARAERKRKKQEAESARIKRKVQEDVPISKKTAQAVRRGIERFGEKKTLTILNGEITADEAAAEEKVETGEAGKGEKRAVQGAPSAPAGPVEAATPAVAASSKVEE